MSPPKKSSVRHTRAIQRDRQKRPGIEPPPEEIEALIEEIGRLLRLPAPVAIASAAIGRRPIPRDAVSFVGPATGLDGLYIALTHSGITLAPALGRFIADEILTGRREPLLMPFGLERLGRG